MNAMLAIPGPPATKGSWRLFVSKNGKPHVRPSCMREKAWGSEIAVKARERIKQPFQGPVRITIVCYFKQPKRHRGEGCQTTRPDADKIARSVLDALTGIAYRDDSQVSYLTVLKLYAKPSESPVTVISVGAES